MSKKYPYKPSNYGYYVSDRDPDRSGDRRDEFGLYYKKHREKGVRYVKKRPEILNGFFIVEYSDGKVEKFIINDSYDADRENNEISSSSPLAIGANSHNPGDYFSIPSGKVLLLEKNISSLNSLKPMREVKYKNKYAYKYLPNYIQKDKLEKNIYNKINNKLSRVDRYSELYVDDNHFLDEKDDDIIFENDYHVNGNDTNIEYNDDINLTHNDHTLNLLIIFLILTFLVILLIIIVFTNVNMDVSNCATSIECTDSQVSSTNVRFVVLFLFFMPIVGYITCFAMIPVFGLGPLIIRVLFTFILYLIKNNWNNKNML